MQWLDFKLFILSPFGSRWETRSLSSLHITCNLPIITYIIINNNNKKKFERGTGHGKHSKYIWTRFLIGCCICIDAQYNALFMSHWRNWLLTKDYKRKKVSYWLFFLTTVILARNSNMLPPPYSLSDRVFLLLCVWVDFFFVNKKEKDCIYSL